MINKIYKINLQPESLQNLLNQRKCKAFLKFRVNWSDFWAVVSVLVWFDEKAIFFITLCVLPRPYFLYISLCLIKLCDLYFIHILSVLLKYLNTQKYYSIYFYLRNLWNLCISVNASINKLENTLNPYRCHG